MRHKIRLNKAFVLAGGFGTRMKELTKNTPKPMLPLQGKPILEYTIDLCRRYGIHNIGVSVHYLAEKIYGHFGNGSRFGMNMLYIQEAQPLGTAGSLRLAKGWLTEDFMMCNADELKDINLQEMYEQHIATGAWATIALTEVKDPQWYGVAELDGECIRRFVEKPKPGEEPSNLINAGLYIISPEVIKLVPEGYAMMEKDIFPVLAKQGKLCGFKFKGQWYDTGTPERYTNAEAGWKGFTEKPLQIETFPLAESARKEEKVVKAITVKRG